MKLLIFSLLFLIPASAYGSEVYIPEDEFVGYFDSNGFYTVIGNIKNNQSYSVIPTITISIIDGQNTISKSFEYAPVLQSKELPFKIKFPEITSENPILEKPEISYVKTNENPIDVEVIYDNTLVKHDDGHLTGRIINNGDHTVHNIKIFAIIHGHERVLDMGQNIEYIEKIEPGEIVNFSMYPDPSITEEVFYYSCFAPSRTSVVPVYSERNGEKFYFRYDAGTWYYDAQFNEKGTELSMKTQTSFSLETYANFEFPPNGNDEKFSVTVNGEEKQFIQSVDEIGNWHVAFIVEPKESGEIIISGFAEDWNPGDGILIPDWVRFNADSWVNGLIEDKIFASGIQFMINEEIISVPEFTAQGSTSIPFWVKNNAKWWAEGIISDEEYTDAIKFLIEDEVIQI